jgi:hypothetical protein
MAIGVEAGWYIRCVLAEQDGAVGRFFSGITELAFSPATPTSKLVVRRDHAAMCGSEPKALRGGSGPVREIDRKGGVRLGQITSAVGAKLAVATIAPAKNSRILGDRADVPPAGFDLLGVL